MSDDQTPRSGSRWEQGDDARDTPASAPSTSGSDQATGVGGSPRMPTCPGGDAAVPSASATPGTPDSDAHFYGENPVAGPSGAGRPLARWVGAAAAVLGLGLGGFALGHTLAGTGDGGLTGNVPQQVLPGGGDQHPAFEDHEGDGAGRHHVDDEGAFGAGPGAGSGYSTAATD